MCQQNISTTTSDRLDCFFIVHSENFNKADSYVVAIFHGVYPSSSDAWLKVSEVVDHLNTQSHDKGIGRGKFIQDMRLGNIWCHANGDKAVFTITPIDAR